MSSSRPCPSQNPIVQLQCGHSEVFHLENRIRDFFIWMCPEEPHQLLILRDIARRKLLLKSLLLQRLNSATDHILPDTKRIDTRFLNLLQLTHFSQMRIRHVSRTKLTCADDGEGALGVVAWTREPACSRGEDGGLRSCEMRGWDVEDEPELGCCSRHLQMLRLGVAELQLRCDMDDIDYRRWWSEVR
jgi:hypothetical protein